jgi:uncharacterized protein (DUF1778 family)
MADVPAEAGERGLAAAIGPDRAGRVGGDAGGGAAPAVDVAVVARSGSGRRRRRQVVARPHAVFARFSVEEFEVVGVAAAAAGLTPTSFVAARAVAVARGVVRPVPSGTAEVVRELVEARTQLVRFGVLLNQAVAKLNATGQVDGALVAAVRRCDAATASLRAATERLGRQR